MRCVLFLCCLLLAATVPLAAQDSSTVQPVGGWVEGGFGLSSMGFLSGVVGLAGRLGDHQLLARTTGHSEELFGGDEVWDVGLLYGRGYDFSDSRLAFYVGIAAVGGSHGYGLFSGQSRTYYDMTIGFPVQVDVVWSPVNVFGIGLCGFANVNTIRSVAGFSVLLQLGVLR